MPRVETDEEVRFVPKLWGWEQWIANNESYCGKVVFIKSGQHSSYHFHPIKDQVLHVQEGLIHLVFEDPETKEPTLNLVRKGMSFRIPPGMKHQFQAVRDTMMVEVSTHHSDVDVVMITREEVKANA
jgi:quercetin dioxygenase-like cupin family protein